MTLQLDGPNTYGACRKREGGMADTLNQLSPSTIHTIGNTPIVQLQKVVPKNSADVLVKLEYFNPTGSYKDRMAK